MAAPFFLAEALEAAHAEIILVGFSFFVEQVGELHGLEYAVDHHGGAQASAEAEKKHAAAFVAAEGLHGGIVDDSDGTSKRFRKIEIHPSAAEVMRFAERAAVDDRAGIAVRDAVIAPVLGGCLDLFDHLGSGHFV